MTALADGVAAPADAPLTAVPAVSPSGLEVSTTASDALRASVRVAGRLTARTCPLLLGVITTHVRAGRRHLRLDLSQVTGMDDAVLGHLAQAHAGVQAAGGMLLFDNAATGLAEVLRGSGVLVVPAA